MNKWVKRKWVKALRSGEYTQGKGWLVQGTGYTGYRHCCLGVLACEMVPEFVKRKNVDELAIDGRTDFIPDDLAILFELDFDSQDKLANLNDDGKSFSEIADYIEREL